VTIAFEIPRQVVFTGAVTGLTYGVLAVGLLLLYRSTRVVNFAYGEMGAFGAALLALLVINYDWNYWAALVAVLVTGAAIGAAVELTVVRRLFTAPRVVLLAATIGVAQLLLLAQIELPGLERFEAYPTPFDSAYEVGGVRVRSEHLLVLIVVPIVTGALAWFLARTRYGTAVRAAAANADAARTSAIPIKRLSTLVWVLAGALATLTALLVAPFQGSTAVTAEALGPALMVRALAAAVLARFQSPPIAVVAGTAIGIVEAILFYNDSRNPGRIEALLFVVVLGSVLVLVRGRSDEGRTTWSFTSRVRPIPAALAGVRWIRWLGPGAATAAVLAAIALPLVVTEASRQLLYTRMLLMAMIAVSLTVVTGWAGQLSLGQFALVGIGAMSTTALVRNGMSFELAVPAAAVLTVVTAVAIGVPALRIRGLFLAVTTLAFGVMCERWLLSRSIFIGDDLVAIVPRARFGDSFTLEPQRTYYYVCLAVTTLAVLASARLRRSGLGRSIVAVRENEHTAAAFTISPARTKLTAFAFGGALAGIAGGLLAGLLVNFQPDLTFRAGQSLQIVAIAVIGGLSSATGAVLGTLWVIGLPALFGDNQTVALLTSGIGLLIVLMYLPGGLVDVLYRVRNALFDAIARRHVPEAATTSPARVPVRPRVPAARPAPSAVALATDGVSVRFGGRIAVDDVSITVRASEVVGLIGANGAGKTTLMNAIGGFVRSTGEVQLLGRRVTGLAPARRARLGLGRTFQGAELFPDLTVVETVQTALEARARTHLVGAIVATPWARSRERSKRSEADEVIAFLGLGPFSDRFVSELSTGTRRILELACLLALAPRVLCLDEPTAGIAQRETESFAPLILRVRKELDASLLVIEHDMPFIMGISERVYCLEAGVVIAEGTPGQVRRDPNVIASYLGTEARAIERSGPATRRS
jgi:ABC-type branched-subunit amino acid transport system ATPase component/ABC-type branched-subunit amino acid transport system permease subunit